MLKDGLLNSRLICSSGNRGLPETKTEAGPEAPAKKTPCLNATVACERMLWVPRANFTSCRCFVPAPLPSHELPGQWAAWQQTDTHHVSAPGIVPSCSDPWGNGAPGMALLPGTSHGLRVVQGSEYTHTQTHSRLNGFEEAQWFDGSSHSKRK